MGSALTLLANVVEFLGTVIFTWDVISAYFDAEKELSELRAAVGKNVGLTAHSIVVSDDGTAPVRFFGAQLYDGGKDKATLASVVKRRRLLLFGAGLIGLSSVMQIFVALEAVSS
jgi:hypothetical protein